MRRVLLLIVFMASIVPAVKAQDAPIVKEKEEGVVSVTDDFLVGPTQFDLSLKVGETREVPLIIVNRQGKESRFRVVVEDFAADPERPGEVQLYGDAAGPYTARSWVTPLVREFSLTHGERATVLVRVRVPADADAGDHYAAVLVERVNDATSPSAAYVNVISRIGSLFLVRVEGKAVESGALTGLSAQHRLFVSYPINLALRAKNDGTVRMKPTGTVTIRNTFGSVVARLPVQSWTVLRASSGRHALQWQPPFALGRYTAEARVSLFPGQEPQVVRSSFWVAPIAPVLFSCLFLFFAGWFLRRLRSRFRVIVVRQK